MLNAKYNVYKHVNTGETIVRTTSYRKKPIGGQVPTLKTVSPGAGVPASCVGVITPACLFALYNAAGYVPTATDKNVLGVAGYLDQFANYADMQVCIRMLFRSSHLTFAHLCSRVDVPRDVRGCRI